MKKDQIVLIGTGVLSWNAIERRCDRYGSVILMQEGTNSLTIEEAPVDLETEPVDGKLSELFAIVTETRNSTHIGDFFRGIGPSVPEKGEKIVFGEGLIFHERDKFGYHNIGLMPLDGRKNDWLDPEKLYRAHEQSVELYCRYLD